MGKYSGTTSYVLETGLLDLFGMWDSLLATPTIKRSNFFIPHLWEIVLLM
jgi:hypothetical protein